ncbi:MAG: hybrid sensor histidine kinase/response regulator [Polyangiaceae bacterium]|nr:hybrid sensor histidine kinase/response regulator [Polyangiaceae bacterium]
MPTILHIEDDPANRLLVRKLLSPQGFDVIDATDGLEGIRKARADRPDLILVDIAIPGMDGYEVTLRLRAEPKLQGVPIVAITAEGSRDASLAVGCDGFLQKPIDARSFARNVRGYLKGHREATSADRTDTHLRAQSQRIVGHLEEKIAELSAANQQLREVAEARKAFYRNISHELATPMTPIVGYVKLLRDEELGPLSKAQGKAMSALDDCVQRLRGLIENLLDVTAIETGKLRFALHEYDLVDVVRKAVDKHRPSVAQKPCRMLLELPSSLPGLGDGLRIGRAVEQLLDNAVKFTPAGGTIGVRARQISEGTFEVCIADTGPGLPVGLAERVFEPFYQVDGSPTRSHGGTGVGLAIARGIVEGHGGTTRVESPSQQEVQGEVLAGAAFFLFLPARPASLVAGVAVSR